MNRIKYFLMVIPLISSLLLLACAANGGSAEDNPVIPSETGTVTDYEGNIYTTIKIGNQWWMSENLKTTHKADGSALTGVYAYNDDENNVTQFGRLYEYNAALTGTPTGWHLPTDSEWDILENTLGSDQGTKLKVGGSSGFKAKLGGYRTQLSSYESINQWGSYWSSVLFSSDHGYIRNVQSDQSIINHWGSSINSALSVRYIKD